jgi:hypothetical protein
MLQQAEPRHANECSSVTLGLTIPPSLLARGGEVIE